MHSGGDLSPSSAGAFTIAAVCEGAWFLGCEAAAPKRPQNCTQLQGDGSGSQDPRESGHGLHCAGKSPAKLDMPNICCGCSGISHCGWLRQYFLQEMLKHRMFV